MSDEIVYGTFLLISLHSSKQLGPPVVIRKKRGGNVAFHREIFLHRGSEPYHGLLISCNEETRRDKNTNSFIHPDP